MRRLFLCQYKTHYQITQQLIQLQQHAVPLTAAEMHGLITGFILWSSA